MKIPVVQVASDKRMSTVLCTRAILPHEVVQATSENDIGGLPDTGQKRSLLT